MLVKLAGTVNDGSMYSASHSPNKVSGTYGELLSPREDDET